MPDLEVVTEVYQFSPPEHDPGYEWDDCDSASTVLIGIAHTGMPAPSARLTYQCHICGRVFIQDIGRA